MIEKGYHITGLDTCYYTDELSNKEKKSYKLIVEDIRNTDKIDLTNIDAIIHLAALSNDPMGALKPELTYEINEKASIRLAEKAKKQGVKRFLFSSSCSIYGIGTEETVSEKSKTNPLTAYAKSKIAVEEALQTLADDSFTVGLLRNSTVYGYSPKYRNDLVVNNLVSTAVAFNEIKIMSDGSPWRPLIDVRDLSDIFIAFLQADSSVINGEIFNIGFNENNFQVKDIGDMIKEYLPDCSITYTGEHGSDSRSYKVNFDKFKKAFPQVIQQWQMTKSIKDLIDRLQAIHFSADNFKEGKFIRLNELQEKINNKSIDENLFNV